MPSTFEDNGKQLLEAAIKDYETLRGANGPISGGALNITKAGGLAAVLSGIAAGVGTLFAATKGAPASVTIATLGVAGIAILALAWIIRSDHLARTAVTVDVTRVVPKLLLAAHASTQQAPAPPVHAAAMVTSNGTANASPSIVQVNLKAMLKENNAPFTLVALRLGSGDPEYLVARLGQGALEWKKASEVERILP